MYLKVEDTSSVVLDPYNNNIPDLNQVIVNYGIDTMKSAFKAPDAVLQRIYRIHFQDTSRIDSLIIDLKALNFIEYAEKIPFHYTGHIPNDLTQDQWGLRKISAESAWDISQGSSGVSVAIVDNAVLTTHEDLVGNIWVNQDEQAGNGIDDDLNGYVDDRNGYDVADDDENPNPPSGTSSSSSFKHGTHCSGIASAVTDNGKGIASLGYNLSIISVKCASDTGNGQALTHAYEGIDYAVSAGADVVSMSFGTTSNSATGSYIINYASTNGVVLLASAGNSDTTQQNYPAAYGEVIAVGATNSSDEKAWFSNYGNWIDVMAPGVNIQSTLTGGTSSYGKLSGTSMSCPLVAALAGLILSKENLFTPSQVKDRIVNGCDNINAQNPGYTGQLGAGRINAYQSLLLTGKMNYESKTSDMLLYPNPTSGHLNVSFKKTNTNFTYNINSYKILDPSGRVILFSDVQKRNEIKIPLKNELEKGVYFLEITADYEKKSQFKFMRKFIVE